MGHIYLKKQSDLVSDQQIADKEIFKESHLDLTGNSFSKSEPSTSLATKTGLILIWLLTGFLFWAGNFDIVKADDAVWAPEGAKWWYSYSYVGHRFLVTVERDGDTIINSKNVYVLETGNPDGQIFTYEDSGIVFQYNSDRFDTLYNFNAKPGDTWQIPVHPESQYCDTSNIVEVIDTNTVILNNQKLKQLIVEYSLNVNYDKRDRHKNVIDTITERIGGRKLTFLYTHYVCEQDGHNIFSIDLRCYEDINFPLYSTGIVDSCDQVISSLSGDHIQRKYELYPNPANGHEVFIRTPLNGVSVDIAIYNTLGRRVYFGSRYPGSNGTIHLNLNHLDSGLYYVSLNNNKVVQPQMEKLLITK